MDFALLSKPGIGVQTALSQALSETDRLNVLRIHEVDDLGASIQSVLEEAQGRPVVLLLDACSLGDMSAWVEPLSTVLETRTIGGGVLPEGSSIIINTWQTSEEFQKLPGQFTDKLKLVDANPTAKLADFESLEDWGQSVTSTIRSQVNGIAKSIAYDRLATLDESKPERKTSPDEPSL